MVLAFDRKCDDGLLAHEREWHTTAGLRAAVAQYREYLGKATQRSALAIV